MRRRIVRRRNPRPVNLVMDNIGLLAVVGLVAFMGWRKLQAMYAAGTINPASRDNAVYQSVGEPGLKIADWFGGAFKSDAEKAVDAMLMQQTAQSVPDLTRVLRYGMAGTDVKLLQQLLGVAADGAFGDQTLAAVRAFQQSKGLVVDGAVGPATWNALRSGRAIVTQTGQLISGADRALIR